MGPEPAGPALRRRAAPRLRRVLDPGPPPPRRGTRLGRRPGALRSRQRAPRGLRAARAPGPDHPPPPHTLGPAGDARDRGGPAPRGEPDLPCRPRRRERRAALRGRLAAAAPRSHPRPDLSPPGRPLRAGTGRRLSRRFPGRGLLAGADPGVHPAGSRREARLRGGAGDRPRRVATTRPDHREDRRCKEPLHHRPLARRRPARRARGATPRDRGEHLERVEVAALLHDIGKLQIPDELLESRDRLSPRGAR